MRIEPLTARYLLTEGACYVTLTSFGKGSEYILEPYYLAPYTSLYRCDNVIFVGMLATLIRRTFGEMDSLCLH